MTDADKVMNPQYFGSDPAQIHFWLSLGALVEFVLSECSCLLFNNL